MSPAASIAECASRSRSGLCGNRLAAGMSILACRRSPAWILVLTLISGDGQAAPFVAPRDAHCVAFAPDGQTVAIGISGQCNGEFPPRPHPSPRKCAVLQLFDLASQKRLRRIETFGDLTQIAFSPDGGLIAAARLFVSDDGIELNEVRVWEVATGRPRFAFDRCHAFSFAPHRDEVMVVSRQRCVVYDLSSGERLRQLPSLANALRIAHVAGGEEVCGIVPVTAGFAIRNCNSVEGTLRVESTPIADPFYSLAVSRSGAQLATGHAAGLVILWSMATLQPEARISTGGAGRAHPFLSPTGELLGAADQTNSDVVIWDLATGRELSRYTFRQGAVHTYLARSPLRVIRPEEDPARFVFAPDGMSFLGGPFGGILRLVADGRDIARFGE